MLGPLRIARELCLHIVLQYGIHTSLPTSACSHEILKHLRTISNGNQLLLCRKLWPTTQRAHRNHHAHLIICKQKGIRVGPAAAVINRSSSNVGILRVIFLDGFDIVADLTAIGSA